MLKKILIILVVIVIFAILPQKVKAQVNNIYGIHIADTSNLSDVSKLVNSNGGDWGYVTFVIQKGERDPARWQQIFDEMRRLHLIPIVRIATVPIAGNDNTWEVPNVGEIDGWVSFLNSLNWVIKNRYVIIGNEPNHAKEWGGQIDPAGYGSYLKLISQKLKQSNSDFFVMPAGFDASAPNQLFSKTDATMDESLYLEKMTESDSHVFDYIDGWASHSYPNPAFAGPGNGVGKGSVSTFDWELNYLKYLGVSKELPVFITETGWTHDTNTLNTNIGPKIETAFTKIWNDPRIMAVTPFIYKYTDPPFDTFSWVNKDGQFYDFYYNVLNLPKIKGDPVQNVSGDIVTGVIPKIATTNTNYHAVLFVKNTGQSIWQLKDMAATDNDNNKLTIESLFPDSVEPNQIGFFLVDGKFFNIAGAQNIKITLSSRSNIVTTFSEEVNLIPRFPNFSEVWDYIKFKIFKN